MIKPMGLLAIAGLCVVIGGPAAAEYQTVAAYDQETIDHVNGATVKIVAKAGQSTSHGAGVCITPDGYILTAMHVIDQFPRVQVVTTDGDVYSAEVVETDHAVDIALLKINPETPLDFALLSSSKPAADGRETIVAGNPMGMGQALVAGTLAPARLVSWDGRKATLPVIKASIFKGHSGGGAFDARTGELLGIVVAKSSLQKETGYIVPTEKLAAIIQRKKHFLELVDAENIDEQLGVRLRPVMLTAGQKRSGLLITAIRPGSLAEQAGWQPGDVLLGLDKYQTINQEAVMYVLEQAASSRKELSFLLARGDRLEQGRLPVASATPVLAASLKTQARPELARVQ